MAQRKILTSFANEPELRRVSRPVTAFDRRLHALLDDMHETMVAADGVGLAAPQVGILRRIVVIDVGEGCVELINPAILVTEGEQEVDEACLSVPGKHGKTIRPAKVRVRAQARDGQWFEMDGEELLAVAFSHELEHLDGKLYVDRVIGALMDVEKQ